MKQRYRRPKEKVFKFSFSYLFPGIARNIYLMAKYSCIIHPFARISFIENLKIGSGTIIGKCDIFAQGKIRIGRQCIINDYAILDSRNGFINIGSNTAINTHCVIYGAGGVDIGRNCAIAPFVKIMKNHQIPKKLNERYDIASRKYTEIGDYVWIGSDVIIVDGVRIGDNTIIGANSFVSENIPTAVIAAGTPAKIIRKRQGK